MRGVREGGREGERGGVRLCGGKGGTILRAKSWANGTRDGRVCLLQTLAGCDATVRVQAAP
jgi:hypothetical protein